MAQTITIHCTVKNGLTLRLYEFKPDEAGIPVACRKGEPVELACGDNEVPADFWRSWLEQNPDSSLIAHGALRIHSENH